jgi:SAM-dependent methyltransferase
MKYVLCIDYSAAMLRQLRLHFAEERLEPPIAIKASAMGLPLQTESLNCIFTFNAIHHFGLPEFLREAARLLQPNGHLFVYTRTRTQNSQTIWGKHFPWFASKESRLHELDELSGAIDGVPALDLVRVQAFRFQRHGKLVDLIHRARNHHYSTFGLYSPREFNAALRRFARNLLRYFPDAHSIRWIDENTLLTLRKVA